MPASTPIYGFPYPLGTDPVANGAQDIQNLATSVETTVNKVGLWLINTFTNSNTTSITCNDVFSSQFRNYRVMHVSTGGAGATAAATLQFNIAGVPTATTYAWHEINSTNTAGPTRVYLATQTSMRIGYFSSGISNFALDIYEPNISGSTSLLSSFVSWGSTANIGGTIQGSQLSASAFTGFAVSCANAFTGVIKVYGYN
jgi:hypothetical protein